MVNFLRHYFLVIFFLVLLFFYLPILFQGRLPVPADTIVGLYHPFRDLYADDYPRGIPFKNFLITDPVRQIYPWKKLVIESLFHYQLPLWNPYEMAGKPLLANFQSSVFYPLNILLLISPFHSSWSMFIILQQILAGIFLYLYLDNFKLDRRAIFLGVTSWVFSGFFIAWLEWGNIVHTALWLPLILLAKEKLLRKISPFWIAILIFAEVSQVFAGHLQIYFYSLIFSNIYLIVRIFQLSYSQKKSELLLVFARKYVPFLVIGLVVFLIASVQILPTIHFILESARDTDQAVWQTQGWFVPWQHMIQFIAPDFFGNPATGNYWGVWNYGELVGYIGLVGLVFSIIALSLRRDLKTLFFGGSLLAASLFAFPTGLSFIPYIYSIPFISSAQPTRLIFIICFSLSVLAALGFDYVIRQVKSDIVYKAKLMTIFLCIGIVISSLWIFVYISNNSLNSENISVAQRNLYFPTVIFVISSVCIFLLAQLKNSKTKSVIIICILVLVTVDLVRFGTKFTPFTDKQYLFPQTRLINFLQNQTGVFRIASANSQILPPNFATEYRIQSIEGYDPLYLKNYAEFIAASEREEPNISPPFGYNRIITPHNIDSRFIDFLNVKYVLTFDEISNEKFKKVFEEGKTKVYENTTVSPRAFFVNKVFTQYQKQDVIYRLFDENFDIRSMAVIEAPPSSGKMDDEDFQIGTAKIIEYSMNKIIIQVDNKSTGFLVLSDAFYPSWKAVMDRGTQNEVVLHIHKTNHAFRGVTIPISGKHTIEFYNTFYIMD